MSVADFHKAFDEPEPPSFYDGEIGEPPADERELPHAPHAVIHRALKRDEMGDAELFAYLYRGKAVYDLAEKQWYRWDGRRWRADTANELRRTIAGHIASEYLHLAAALNIAATAANPLEATEENQKAADARGRAVKRANALHTRRRIDTILDLAHSFPGMAITGSEWDADPWLLGVENGVLDLRTGQLRDGRPDDYLRTVAPTRWQGLDEGAPRWERFISEVMSDEPDRVAFVQRLLGYALNGSTKEHVLGVFVGARGRNGKRVLFEALQYVLGDYTKSVSTDVLIGQDHMRIAGSAQPHLMELQGKRLAYCSETGEHDRLSTAQVKNITGGDPITARWLHSNPVTFMPTHTLFLQTNRKPQAPADDDALWERVKVIEFKVRFVDEPDAPDERPRDLSLEDALQREASGILAWLVRGGLAWQHGGLQTPASVRLARDTYRRGESIEPFIDACCHEWDGGSAEGGTLYEGYKAWCNHYDLQPKSAVWFGKQLIQQYEKARITAGANAGRVVYYGISLRSRHEWALEEQVTKTLQGEQNPSDSIGKPNQASKNENPEGLRSFSKSSMQFSPHEGKNMENPSNPSNPSGQASTSPPLPPGYRIIASAGRACLHHPNGAITWHASPASAQAAAHEHEVTP